MTLTWILAAALVTFGLRGTAHAVLAAVSTDPVTGGVLTHPGNGFPVWYQDTAGVALEQCNFNVGEADPNCLPFADDEHFWWTGDAALTGPGVTDALLVLALEAAFATGDPVPGQQIVFGRIRIRADVQAPGTYTVTHPFGSRVFQVGAVGAGDEINETVDVMGGPLDFTTVLGATIGPFLTCVSPAPPLGYLGNGATPCTVTGSPNNTNVFTIQGPQGTVSTDQFVVTGKIFTGIVPLPVTVDRATYACPSPTGPCTAEIFAHSVAAAALTVEFPTIGATQFPMSSDGRGSFFLSTPISRTALPTVVDEVTPALPVAITATATGFTPVTVTQALHDLVTVTEATYNKATGILTVRAGTSDARITLQETSYGPLGNGLLRFDVNGFSTVSAAPPHVNVVSTVGGRDLELTSLVSVPEVLTITRAEYDLSLKRYTVTGTSNAVGATVALVARGVEVGRARVSEAGRFTLRGTATPRAAQIRVNSSGGDTALRRVTVVP